MTIVSETGFSGLIPTLNLIAAYILSKKLTTKTNI